MPKILNEKYMQTNCNIRQKYRQNNYEQEFIRKKSRIKTKNKNKHSVLYLIIAVIFLGLYGYFICPYGYKHFIKPLYINRFLNRNTHLDIKEYINPSYKYLHNSYLFKEPLLVPYSKKGALSEINVTKELNTTKQKLFQLFKKYPDLAPSVFVWDYTSQSAIDIRSDEIYPSASIIKIPILIELINKISYSSKTSSPMSLEDKRLYTDEFKTLGSGKLQYAKSNVLYSLNHLADIMISNSDNSATNMILYEIGGVDGFNKAMRSYGLKSTSMQQWLPDMEGYNTTSAKEISTLLYNLDNVNFISTKYKNIIKEYLNNTKNTHLLKEKLPNDIMIFHKTGNIAEMLGDSGIIYTRNHKKYIVSILVKRPKNSTRAKNLIQEASLIIYNDIDTQN